MKRERMMRERILRERKMLDFVMYFKNGTLQFLDKREKKSEVV